MRGACRRPHGRRTRSRSSRRRMTWRQGTRHERLMVSRGDVSGVRAKRAPAPTPSAARWLLRLLRLRLAQLRLCLFVVLALRLLLGLRLVLLAALVSHCVRPLWWKGTPQWSTRPASRQYHTTSVPVRQPGVVPSRFLLWIAPFGRGGTLRPRMPERHQPGRRDRVQSCWYPRQDSNLRHEV
jgi:hypothetical protein